MYHPLRMSARHVTDICKRFFHPRYMSLQGNKNLCFFYYSSFILFDGHRKNYLKSMHKYTYLGKRRCNY